MTNLELAQRAVRIRVGFRAAGRCSCCGDLRDCPNRLRCEACRASQNARDRKVHSTKAGRQRVAARRLERRQKWIVGGVCALCGCQKDRVDLMSCQACRNRDVVHKRRRAHRRKEMIRTLHADRRRAYIRRRTAIRVARGVCIRCQLPCERDDRVTCEVCLEHGRIAGRRLMAIRKFFESCRLCGGNLADNSRQYCPRHLATRRSSARRIWRQKRDARASGQPDVGHR